MNATATKQAAPKRIIAQVKVLQHYITSERSIEGEREMARHRLAVFCEKYVIPGINDNEAVLARVGDTDRWLFSPGAWKGEKYDQVRRMTLTEIAKLMREEIKFIRKVAKKTAPKSGELAMIDPIGDAPTQVKISIRTEYYSGGGSINIRITNVPQEWGWTEETNDRGDVGRVATPALLAMWEAVEQIQNQYNYDNSDAMTDYFDKNFYGHVDVEPEGVKYGRIVKPSRW